MSVRVRRFTMAVLVAAAAASTFLWNGEFTSSDTGALVSTAEAVIGRPVTPVSYAGVARRTTRRAVVGTAAVVGTTAAVAGCP